MKVGALALSTGFCGKVDFYGEDFAKVSPLIELFGDFTGLSFLELGEISDGLG